MTSTTNDYPNTNEGHLGQPITGTTGRDNTATDSYLDRNDGNGLDSRFQTSDNARTTGQDSFISKEPNRIDDSIGGGNRLDDSKQYNTRSSKLHDRDDDYTRSGTDGTGYASSRRTEDQTLSGAGARTDASEFSRTNDSTGYTDRTDVSSTRTDASEFSRTNASTGYTDRTDGSGAIGGGARTDEFDSAPVRGASGYEPGDDRTGTDSYGDERSSKKGDSTMGKMMEKAGGVLKNQNLVEKGIEKREDAAARAN